MRTRMKCTTILTIIILVLSIWAGYNWDTTQVHVSDLIGRIKNYTGSQSQPAEKVRVYKPKPVEEPKEKFDIPVHWMAPFFSGGGYCSEAISFVSAIMNNLTYLSIEQHGDSMNQKFMDGLPNSDTNVIKQLYRSAQKNSISICHSEPGAWSPAKYSTSLCPLRDAVYKIGRTMFETDRNAKKFGDEIWSASAYTNKFYYRIPQGWAERINGMDEVWVPTKFQAEVFEQQGVDPAKIVLMPEAVDIDFFNPEDVPVLELDKFANYYEDDLLERFRFLSIFKWEKRKGWDILLKAYLNEFSASEKVVLFIVTNPYHAKEKNEHLLQVQALKEQIAAESNKKLEDLPTLLIVDKHILQRRMPNLYKSAHVLVIPSRGEGWGRPHVEAMSMEVPVIATNWSGPTEFMTEENSFPLKINGLVQVGEGPFKDHMWADPSIEHLRERMRFAFAHRDEVEKRGKKAREDMVTKYSPRRVGDIVVNRLKEIRQKIKK